MKVLMTADTLGGVWSYALELAAALGSHEVRIVLATMGAPLTPGQRADASSVGNLEIVESAFRLEWMDDPWDDVARAGEWLLQLEREHAPDVVHLNGYAHAALPWNAPVCVVAHSCVLSWWRAVHGESAPLTWARYRTAVASGLAAADTVIAPSDAMLYALGREYGTVQHARVIHNGRSAAAFPRRTKEPFVLAAGRLWDEAKNVAALEAVAPNLPWPVYVAGSADPPSTDGRTGPVTRTSRALGVLRIRELAEWMGRAEIYALPARYEPFGLSVLEAALAGCALVLGDIPSLRELWDGAALFVDPDDHAGLTIALRTLIDDADLRARTAAACRARALGYTSERMSRAYLDTYEALVSASHMPARRLACAS